MRIGYSYWGFLGDNKLDKDLNNVSAPDGNATYSWALIHEAIARGHDVYQMQEDRDYFGYDKYGPANFCTFSASKRYYAWLDLRKTDSEPFPELDVLLLEWRFPIDGRNVDVMYGVFDNGEQVYSYDKLRHQPDFYRQLDLLRHYSGTKTKIIVWDLDHKLETRSEEDWNFDAIFETSVQPKHQFIKRTSVEFPTIVADMLEYTTLSSREEKKLVYVGSRYERDDVITEWINPTANAFPGQVQFYGNWLKSVDQCRELWPHVKYMDRITTNGFREAYGRAVACPLLAKRSYLKTGFITPRPYEALIFGTLPVGLKGHLGIEKYVLPEHIAESGEHMVELVKEMSTYNVDMRRKKRRENADKLEFMDAKYFVDKIEEVVNET